MTAIATVVCLVIAFGLVAHAGLRALANRAVDRVDLIVCAALEVAVVFYIAVRVIDLAGGHRTQGLVIVVPYLIGLALIVPIAVALARVEPTRWGSAILVAGALVVAVLFARINQLWNPAWLIGRRL